MTEYFIFVNGQEGPFTIDQLRTKNLTLDTPAWHDGLTGWSTAGQIPELRNLVKVVPPPFVKPAPPAPPPFQTASVGDYEYEVQMAEFFAPRKRTDWGTVLWVSFSIGCLLVLIWALNR